MRSADHPTSPTFAGLLPAILADDPASPRLTCYDDLPGPTCGERVELSARVLEKWVAKAATALVERDVAPGTAVQVAATPHWRCAYWALAAWAAGAAVTLDDGPAEVVVTDDPALAGVGGVPGVLLTRASLARSSGLELPWDVLDDAAELASFPDVFGPDEAPAAADPALRLPDGTVIRHGGTEQVRELAPGTRLGVVPGDTGDLLLALRSAWAVAGSVVLVVGSDPDADHEHRWHAEAVTQVW